MSSPLKGYVVARGGELKETIDEIEDMKLAFASSRQLLCFGKQIKGLDFYFI